MPRVVNDFYFCTKFVPDLAPIIDIIRVQLGPTAQISNTLTPPTTITTSNENKNNNLTHPKNTTNTGDSD